MLSNASWSVAIMCYNEAATLEQVVARTRQVLASLTHDFEIVIIDDGSSDGSGPLADRLALSDPHVRVVHHGTNKGIGEVLYSAYRSARKDWVSIIPGDLEFDPGDLPAGYALLGNRIVVNYTLTKLPPLQRRLVSLLQRILNFLLFGLTVSRTNWVKIVPTKELSDFEFTSRSPIIETEILVRLKRRGYRIIEIPSHNDIRLGRRGGMSAQAYVRAIISSFLASFSLWWALRRDADRMPRPRRV